MCGHDLHSLGKYALVQKLDLCIDVAKHSLRFRSLAHLHDAFHHIGVVGNAAVIVTNRLA